MILNVNTHTMCSCIFQKRAMEVNEILGDGHRKLQRSLHPCTECTWMQNNLAVSCGASPSFPDGNVGCRRTSIHDQLAMDLKQMKTKFNDIKDLDLRTRAASARMYVVVP